MKYHEMPRCLQWGISLGCFIEIPDKERMTFFLWQLMSPRWHAAQGAIVLGEKGRIIDSEGMKASWKSAGYGKVVQF